MSLQDLIPWRRQGQVAQQPAEPRSLAAMQREMNRLFESFWPNGSQLGLTGSGFGDFFPNVELSESKKFVDVSAEVPGMDEKDIKVTLSEDADMLTIEGEKRTESEKKSDERRITERYYGHFRRVIGLPARVDGARIEAKYKNGVLDIHMPKLPDSDQKTREIRVSTE